MTVDSLYPGVAFKCKEDIFLGMGKITSPAGRQWLIVERNMSWWGDFTSGENEVLIYLGESRAASGGLLREVLWRGKVLQVRPYDWRHFEILKTNCD